MIAKFSFKSFATSNEYPVSFFLDPLYSSSFLSCSSFICSSLVFFPLINEICLNGDEWANVNPSMGERLMVKCGIYSFNGVLFRIKRNKSPFRSS